MPGKLETRVVHSESGAKLGEGEFLDGRANGVHRLWSANGTLVMEAAFRDGEYHAEYRTWWDNGQPKERGTFERGRRVGTFTWFSEQGSIVKEHVYGTDV
jgi:antitoxin component YwqK of YwqJK toxin-antitoxin module